jgi:hypothetical protein
MQIMTRRFLRLVCQGLIGVLLFAQMAVAAYACPALSSTASMDMQMSSAGASGGDLRDIAMPAASRPVADCADMAGPMDGPDANLCAEHCHYGQQSHQVPALTVPVALLTALYVTPLVPEPISTPRLVAAAAAGMLAAAAPPHAILHCCFRI